MVQLMIWLLVLLAGAIKRLWRASGWLASKALMPAVGPLGRPMAGPAKLLAGRLRSPLSRVCAQARGPARKLARAATALLNAAGAAVRPALPTLQRVSRRMQLPLVLRRLDWMIPTLLIISLISFIIIQLPPGDFLTSQITALQEAGETVSIEKAQELRAQYNLDKPLHEQYLLWMGDLLKGDMGRSFEQNKPVTELIGETIALTVVLSVATLLLTWAIAVPVGIYSAVRQYSIGDYFFTFLGLIGLAVPNFLLALVLLYVAYTQFGVVAVSLFSPEYQRSPWCAAKVWDMLKHMWLPMVIIGLSGTAGLIRILRGNLLDELRKQYVITARAKGVPRLKLLLKYPLRVAINPLISTIGWLLPGLVSGTVITAVVLGLPTTGPLLLRALQNQDMYLAGSMVMLLSTLTVVGTLISDLLLVWVDPRIRYEGRDR